MKKNKGFTLLGLIIGIFVIGTVLVFGTQIGIGYMNKNIVERSIKDVLRENKDETNSQKLKELIAKKIAFNDINLSEKDFIITKNGKGVEVQVEYSKSIRINNEVSILLDFNITETSK